jgi:hypothetical protein
METKQQLMSKTQRRDREGERGRAFWLFGDPKVRERSDSECGLARVYREPVFSARWVPLFVTLTEHEDIQ